MRPGGEDGDEGGAGVRRGGRKGEGERGRRGDILLLACRVFLPISLSPFLPFCFPRFSAYAATSSGVPAATTYPPFVAGLGAHVDHPIGRLDHVEIVLDHDHRVAQLDQPIEHVQQLGDIVEVQAGGRLVEQIQRLPGVGPRKFGGQLHALGLAAGKRRRRLAERQIIEAHVAQRLQDAANLGNVLEQLAPPGRTTCRARRQSTWP